MPGSSSRDWRCLGAWRSLRVECFATLTLQLGTRKFRTPKPSASCTRRLSLQLADTPGFEIALPGSPMHFQPFSPGVGGLGLSQQLHSKALYTPLAQDSKPARGNGYRKSKTKPSHISLTRPRKCAQTVATHPPMDGCTGPVLAAWLEFGGEGGVPAGGLGGLLEFVWRAEPKSPSSVWGSMGV